jgi:transcriptional regulator with XRE-family HTH domain
MRTPLTTNDLNNFRASMRELREENNWSQRLLARRTGWSQGYISDLENGYRATSNVFQLAKWAEGLHCTFGLWVVVPGAPHPVMFTLRGDGKPQTRSPLVAGHRL